MLKLKSKAAKMWPMHQDDQEKYTLWDLAKYFLWLGSFGLGGPMALIGYMQRDLVEKRRWLSHEDYLHGLALAQVCPGPVATQLAIYFGWLKGRVVGATLIAFCLLFPSFVLVTLLAIFYINNVGVGWVVGAFYGIGAAVIAIILKSAYKLALLTCKRERILWAIFLAAVVISPLYTSKIFLILLSGGLVAMCVKAPPFFSSHFPHFIAAPFLFTGINGEAGSGIITKLALLFAWAGAFVFGSGLAIIPILQPIVVEEYQWLTTTQFVDAVSVGLITPGPALITSAFIGYLVAGLVGALVSVVAVFLPCYLCVLILAPIYQKIRKNHAVKSFVSGITSAAAGVMLGACIVLGRGSLVDAATTAIFIATLLLLFFAKKIPDPFLIILAGIVGYIIKN